MAFDRAIASMTVYMEGSGEPKEGQIAIAHVLLNRLKNPNRYGHSLAEVCLKALQFSCWNTLDPNRLRVARATEAQLAPFIAIVNDAIDGDTTDPTGGATHYVALSLQDKPSWTKQVAPTATIGGQEFFIVP